MTDFEVIKEHLGKVESVKQIPSKWSKWIYPYYLSHPYLNEYGGVQSENNYSNQYLTIIANEPVYAFFNPEYNEDIENVSFSLDGGTTWTLLSTTQAPPYLNTGEKIMWKASEIYSDPEFDRGVGKILVFKDSNFEEPGSFNVEGNVMSLLYGDDFVEHTELIGINTFERLFAGQNSEGTKIISAENLILPATTLTLGCYGSMFLNCASLIKAPALPATTLAVSCYDSMFNYCTSLVTAPALPATTLADGCYWYMFAGCTSLTSAPELPATTLAENCYGHMFKNCTSLASTPILPATILTIGCYKEMFFNCANVSTITCLATDISAFQCTDDWLSNVAQTGTFVSADTMEDWTPGSSGIPTGWTWNGEIIQS